LTEVASCVGARDVRLRLADGRTVTADLAYGGVWYAIVDAAEAELVIAPDRVGEAMRLGESIKAAYHAVAQERSDLPQIDPSVLYVSEDGPARGRHLVVLASNKFDRSPCGTGTSARLAQLHAK